MLTGDTAAQTSQPTITFGEIRRLGYLDNGNGNFLAVQNTVLTQSGMLQNLSFWVVNASGQLRLGLYDAAGPGRHARRASGTIRTVYHGQPQVEYRRGAAVASRGRNVLASVFAAIRCALFPQGAVERDQQSPL
jgi:hypothetical protein